MFRRLRRLVDYGVYLVTDDAFVTGGSSIERRITEAIRGGVTCVQLRLKKASDHEFLDLGRRLKPILQRYGVPLIVNNRADIAVALDADGVHVGQDDMPPSAVRSIIGPERILGVTVDVKRPESVWEALKEDARADYVAPNAIFATSTKQVQPIGPEGLAAVERHVAAAAADLRLPSVPPLLAIGGIVPANVPTVYSKAKPNGVCAVSGLLGEDVSNVREVAEAYRLAVDTCRHGKSVAALYAGVHRLLDHLRHSAECGPFLVHHLTNDVVTTQTANATLFVGASPIMSLESEETEQLGAFSSAVVLNGGTLDHQWREAARIALRTAREKTGSPVVLDPVGCGATTIRTDTFKALLEDGGVRIVKGNGGEMTALAKALNAMPKLDAQGGAQVRGVDSIGDVDDPLSILRGLTGASGAVACMSGKRDVIVGDPKLSAELSYSDPFVGNMTGSGCLVATLQASFAAAEKSCPEETFPQYFTSAVAGLAYMSAAARLAHLRLHELEGDSQHARLLSAGSGPAYTYRNHLFDGFATLTPALLRSLFPPLTLTDER
ncbi:unnamed protein product [Vitrella brassicaformis CCMP3155]|uniref:Thiamine phosphate synthase/TenI domain-containing protein n=1 Tax=Vitrella brassicaformis (strain CCMP3155) TaxID=1169540 RepID=A0A0G4EZ86_VITBC|nr:unnamed protein product [Vitrella brassicaformis CCMP3155]|eukprot:CEM04087.1 unnamed protein product [Vitrella brassicaformis CCMP3155]